MRRDLPQRGAHRVPRVGIEIIQLRHIAPGCEVGIAAASHVCRRAMALDYPEIRRRVTEVLFCSLNIPLRIRGHPLVVEAGVVGHEIEHQRDPALAQLVPRLVEPRPASHPGIRLVSLDAIRRAGDVIRRPAGEHAIVFEDERRIGAGELPPDCASAPDAHEKEELKTVLRDPVPVPRRNVRQRDGALLHPGQPLEPRPRADLEKPRVLLHARRRQLIPLQEIRRSGAIPGSIQAAREHVARRTSHVARIESSHGGVMVRRPFVARCVLVALAGIAAAIGARAQAPAKADAEFLRSAYESYRTMRKSSPHAAVPWQYLGPKNISGRATDIAVADGPSGRRIYVGYATSGVWKTDDNGATWQAIFDDMPSTSIGDLAIAPSSPDTLWVGTGEANLFRASMAGVGIYKSTDGGRTFTHMGLTDTQTIGRILVHPDQPEHRLRRRVRPRVDRQRYTRRVQDHRRRHDLEEGLLQERAHRRLGPGDGSLQPGCRLRLDVAARPPQMERSARRARLQRGWNLEDDRRRHDLDRSQHRAAGAAVPRPHRHRHRALESEGAVRIRRQLRAGPPAEQDERDAYRSPIFRSRGSRPQRSTAPTTPARRGERSATSNEFMTRHSGTYGWVFGQIRVDPTDENTIFTLGVPLNVSRDGGKTFAVFAGSERIHGDHHGLWIDPKNPTDDLQRERRRLLLDGGWRARRGSSPWRRAARSSTT